MAEDGQQFFTAAPARQHLLKNKLGALLTWKKPALIQTVGPNDPGAFDLFDTKRMKAVADCVDKLLRCTDDQIAIIMEPGEGSRSYAQEWHRFQTDLISSLIRSIPEWYLGGFGHPDHVADFDHWTKMPRFDVGELTCLTVGIGPNEFSWKQLHSLSTSKDRSTLCKPLEFLVLRYEQMHRKFCRYGRDDTVMPRDFIEWADQFEFEVHPGFRERLKMFHPIQDSSTPAAAPRKHDKREVDSIAQLFTAMAIEQFGYVPDAPRSPTTKEIASLAASLGISITEDTILKYLRIGATFISPDWKPHER